MDFPILFLKEKKSLSETKINLYFEWIKVFHKIIGNLREAFVPFSAGSQNSSKNSYNLSGENWVFLEFFWRNCSNLYKCEDICIPSISSVLLYNHAQKHIHYFDIAHLLKLFYSKCTVVCKISAIFLTFKFYHQKTQSVSEQIVIS